MNHYRAALDAVHTLESELHPLQEQLSITEDDFKQYVNHERRYLEDLQDPSPIVVREAQYVRALSDLTQIK